MLRRGTNGSEDRSPEDRRSEDYRPKPPPNQKPVVIPHTSHSMALAGAIIFALGITIALFGGPWQWLVVGTMFGAILGVGAYFKYHIDINNARAFKQQAQPPANGWKGRGDGPHR